MISNGNIDLNEIRTYIKTVAEENGINPENVIINEYLLQEIQYIVEKYNLPFITHLNFKFSRLKNTGKYKVSPIIPARARISRNLNKVKKIDVEIYEREGKIRVLLERKDGAVFSGIYYLNEYFNEKSPTWREKRWKMLQLRAVNDMIGLYVDEYYMDADVMEEVEVTSDEEKNITTETVDVEFENLKNEAFYKLTELLGTEEEAMNFIDANKIDMENPEILKWIINDENEQKLINRIRKYFNSKKIA